MNTDTVLSLCLTSIVDGRENQLIDSLKFGEAEQNRIRCIKNANYRLQSLCALLALEQALSNNIDGELIISRAESGKPFFKSSPMFFSLSHTDGISLAAVDKSPIGADIEWISSCRDIKKIAERFFTQSEYEKIINSKNPELEFYSRWTMQEAFAKLSGKGLAQMFKTGLPNRTHFALYMLEYNGQKAVISLCAEQPLDKNSITIYNPFKELTLYELQN